MKTSSLLSLVFGILFLASGCVLHIEKGSGQPASEDRALDAFEDVELDGALDVAVVGGDEHRVQISGDDNLVESLVTEVDGDTLIVRTPHNTVFEPRLPLKITVETPELRNVNLNGSGDLRVQGIDGEKLSADVAGSGDVTVDGDWRELEAQVAGSGDIKLYGRSKHLDARVAGSGDIDARGLRALNGRAEVDGSGDVRVCVQKELVVRIAGSGDVHSYCGAEQVRKTISGSGDFHD
jgi:hypothetical protein